MALQLGIISDVHGDVEGLLDALAFFESRQIIRILCAGDLVERGPHGDAVVRLVRQRQIVCVQGNHDFNAVDNQAWLRENASGSPHLLTDETVSWLAKLRPRLDFTLEGVPVLVAHGTPWSREIYLYSSSRPPLFDRVFGASDARVTVLGHTHQPMLITRDERMIANPGSVAGAFTGGSRTCGVLSLPTCTFEVFDIGSGEPYPEDAYMQDA